MAYPKGRRRNRRGMAAGLALVAALSACGTAPQEPAPTQEPSSRADQSTLLPVAEYSATGPLDLRRYTAAKTKYLSGVWVGGQPYADAWHGFGQYRGAPVDAVLGYSDNKSWDAIKHSGNISLFAKFPGTFVYGLGLLPTRGGGAGSLRDVADGKHDDVWRAVGAGLVKYNRKRSIVRIGFEANGTWFSWGATAETAEDFKAAFRRVAGILRESGAEPVIDFDIGCGVGLTGDSDHMAPLTKLYPGDDVVDVMGCDTYDDKGTGAGNPAALGKTGNGPSLKETLDFAKERGKLLVVPEWGLDHTYGPGDHADYITTMYKFFDENADHIALEIYFNEGTTDIKSSLWQPDQNPESAKEYARIWQSRPSAQ
ncbi:MAG: hypothetical protein M9891_13795 [Austwickia sp.]|nr:hypothetical protein [Actinomycetota bacterium]MCO5310327.1 hypothetical protein [Austwickia sp.]